MKAEELNFVRLARTGQVIRNFVWPRFSYFLFLFLLISFSIRPSHIVESFSSQRNRSTVSQAEITIGSMRYISHLKERETVIGRKREN